MIKLYYVNTNHQLGIIDLPTFDVCVPLPENLVFVAYRDGLAFIKEPPDLFPFTDVERLIMGSEFFDMAYLKDSDFRKQNSKICPFVPVPITNLNIRGWETNESPILYFDESSFFPRNYMSVHLSYDGVHYFSLNGDNYDIYRDNQSDPFMWLGNQNAVSMSTVQNNPVEGIDYFYGSNLPNFVYIQNDLTGLKSAVSELSNYQATFRTFNIVEVVGDNIYFNVLRNPFNLEFSNEIFVESSSTGADYSFGSVLKTYNTVLGDSTFSPSDRLGSSYMFKRDLVNPQNIFYRIQQDGFTYSNMIEIQS